MNKLYIYTDVRWAIKATMTHSRDIYHKKTMREMGNTRKLDENKGTFKPNQIHILCNSQMYIGNEIAESLAK